MDATRAAAFFTAIGVLTAGATGFALASPSTPVTLSVDGQAGEVTTTAGTVGKLLDSEDVPVGPHDAVTPGRNTLIRSHQVVQVEHAWRLTVRYDGKSRTEWTTHDTVGETLDQMDVQVGRDDVVSVPLTAGHRSLTQVIKRGTATTKSVKLALPMPVKRIPDSEMSEGTEKVIIPGHAGEEQREVRLVFVERELARITVLGTKVTERAKEQVVAFGTKPKPPVGPPPAPGQDAMAAKWDKVAYCETGGNPTIIAGQFYGMYMMTIQAWEEAGGTGLPSDASAAEQTTRAQVLYNKLGSKPWPVCGKFLH